MNCRKTPSKNKYAHYRNPGQPLIRHLALQPLPNLKTGAAALGYPDTVHISSRHLQSAIVVDNEFTTAGISQNCADELALIINGSVADLWPNLSSYKAKRKIKEFLMILGGTIILFVLSSVHAILHNEVTLVSIILWVFSALVAVFFLAFLYLNSQTISGPTFMLGIKALENAQPALRECLARHGVNGTVRPAREMEGLLEATFCNLTDIRFWVRLDVSPAGCPPPALPSLPNVPQLLVHYHICEHKLRMYYESLTMSLDMLAKNLSGSHYNIPIRADCEFTESNFDTEPQLEL